MATIMTFDILEVQIGSLIREFVFRPKSSDNGVIGQIFIDRSYDLRRLKRHAEIVDFICKGSATGKRPLIVDAGANIGVSAVYFAGQCPDALIVAIEPEATNFQFLAENTRGLNVLPLHGALSGGCKRARVMDPGEGHWGYRTEPARKGSMENTVNCVTINEIYHRYMADYFPFIVKIDVEGSEKEIFMTNTEWVEKTPLIIVELHDWLLPKQGCALPFLRCIAKHDRDFVHISKDIFSISNNLMDLVPHE